MKAKGQRRGWELVGGPWGGTVTAVAGSAAFGRDQTFFVATMAGLFRWQEGEKRWQPVGDDLPGPFLTAVAVSPELDRDGLILTGSLQGSLFRSADRGQTWAAGDFGGRRVNISTVAISPDFARDRACFAGTMADGVFASRNEGTTWASCNFGLLDLKVLDLAISPAFGRDETIFAATTSGVFRTHNGARAWREVAFPTEAAPVQCLAASHDFARDGIVFAGTEAAGIFRSTDRGKTWQQLSGAMSAACVNAIALSPEFSRDHTMLATTESAVCVSRDSGESWSRAADLPGALCLALAPTFSDGALAFVGLSRAGICRSAGNLTSWQMANEGLSGRLLTGLALSPGFAADHRLFVLGPGEGVFQSSDGGVTWAQADFGLPSLQINDLAVAQTQGGEGHLYTGLPEGVWLSREWGQAWECLSELPAKKIALSPDFALDATVVLGTKGQGLWVSHDAGRSWQPVNVPWRQPEVTALALSPTFPKDGQVFVVVSQPDKDGLEVWQGGVEGPWEQVIHHRGAARGGVLAIPPAYPRDGRWYAALGDQLFRPVAGAVAEVRKGKRQSAFVGQALVRERPTIIDLVALPTPQAGHLLAATSRGTYVSIRGRAREAWRPLNQGRPDRPIVALAPSPNYGRDASVYALELGGTLWHMYL